METTNDDLRRNQTILAIMTMIILVLVSILLYKSVESENTEEEEMTYDYSLELKQDDGGCAWIEVRRDSCLFIVHPDSLEEFIIKDNL